MEFTLKKRHKLSTREIYGKLPVWKTLCIVALPAFVIDIVAAFFIFINYFLMIKFMPMTNDYSYATLFISNGTFNDLVNNISNVHLKDLLINNQGNITNITNYENFIKYISISNGLNFYTTADTIRVAISLTTPMLFLIVFFPVLLGPGASVVMSEAIGSRNRLLQIKIWQNEFYISFFLTIIGIFIIAILNYTITPLMIKDALVETIHEQNLHYNLGSSGYLFYDNNGTVIFLKYENGNYFNINTNSIVNVTSNEIEHFNLGTNSKQIIADTFTRYYHYVGNDGILWAEDFNIISDAFLWIVNISYTFINIIIQYGKTGITTIIVVVITVLNILLDWIFIYYCQTGMSSSAITTDITYFGSLVPLVIYMQYLYKHSAINVSLWHLKLKNVMWNMSIVKDMLYIASSTIIKYICYMIVQVLVLNQFSYVTGLLYPGLGSLYFISIMGAVLPVLNFFENSVSNFMPTGTALIAYNYQIKHFDRVIKIVYESSLFIIVYGLVIIGIVGYVTPVSNLFLGIFGIDVNTSSKVLYDCARRFLVIIIAILPIRGVGNNSYMLSRTTKRYITANMIALFRSLVVVVIFLYAFSAVAIDNKDLAIANPTNPILNPYMWELLWVQSSSMLLANFVLIIWIIWFMYKGIHIQKKSITDYKITLFLKKEYLKKLLDESLIKRRI